MNKKTAIIFLLVLAVGIISLFFTFKHLKKEREPLIVDEQGNTQPAEPPAPAPTPAPVVPPKVEPKSVDPEPEPKPAPPTVTTDEELFRSPERLLSALTDLIKARDIEAFIELTGEDAISPADRPALLELLNNPGYAPSAIDPVISLAQIGNLTRWAIQLDPVAMPSDFPPTSGPADASGLPAGGAPTVGNGSASSSVDAAAAAPDPDPLTATTGPAEPDTTTPGSTSAPATPDASKTENPIAGTASDATSPPSTDKASPPIANAARLDKGVSLPPRQIYVDLGEDDKKLVTVEKILVPRPGADGSTNILPPSADPVTVAHGFARAVLNSDFKTARAFSDPEKITDERIAALMIALEEGAYKLQSDRPLIQTLSRDTVSWIVARVQNAETVSEFGLEMSRLDPNTGWRIDNMSFDKVIQMTATAAGGGNVAYAPIVKNPQGGDSLVVFFEFDSAELNVRAQRQVRTIADILKGNPSRQIKINGHADALGLDDYNSALSARRAQTVRDALTALGVASDQIVATGLGASVPLSPNFKPDGSDNPSGRSQNRRSEIYLDF